MGNIVLSASMSLDGFMAGPDVSAEQPLGEGGERLHEWMFGAEVSPADAAAIEERFATTGAVVLGRRTFDVGLGAWQDTPYPVPCFVVTHRPQEPLAQKSGTFTFAVSVESAVAQAKAAAGEKNVVLMGAGISQQALAAGLLDEIHLQLVPVMLGAGSRLFEHLGSGHIDLERTGLVDSPRVTHLKFRVVR